MRIVVVHTTESNRHHCTTCNSRVVINFTVIDDHYYHSMWCRAGDSILEATMANNIFVHGELIYILCSSKLSTDDVRTIAEVMES